MPMDDGAAPNNYATLIFDAEMSEAEVRKNMDQLLALGHRYNVLFEELQRTVAADDTPISKQARIVQLLVDFAVDDPCLGTPSFINLALPLADRLLDEAVRKTQPLRADGTQRKPAAEYTLSDSILRAYLVLAAHILQRSGRTHAKTKKWLRSKLAKHGIKNVTAEAIMKWREQISARMGKRAANEPESEGGFLDLMAQTFKDRRPAQDLGWEEAEQQATELLKDAKLEQKRRLITTA